MNSSTVNVCIVNSHVVQESAGGGRPLSVALDAVHLILNT